MELEDQLAVRLGPWGAQGLAQLVVPERVALDRSAVWLVPAEFVAPVDLLLVGWGPYSLPYLIFESTIEL